METIGRVDKADFPELELEDISVKVDTGAYTSSIHCHKVHEVNENGEKYLIFKLLDPEHENYNNKIFKVKNYKIKSIKSSFGDKEVRYIIKTKILIFNKIYTIELSLTDRSDMRYPILLGRKFLNKKFIVNPALKDLSYARKKKIKE